MKFLSPFTNFGKYNFVEKVEDAFVLTPKGLMSSNIHEIHPFGCSRLGRL